MEFFKNVSLSKSISKLLEKPSLLYAIVGALILIILLLKIKKVKFNTKMITQIGIAVALATVLSFFKVLTLPQGGQVDIGGMLPIIIMALLYGPEVGFLTGFIYCLISLVLDPQIYYPVQVLFDYPLAFMALGLAGYFKNNKYLATIIAIFTRFIFHFISGVVFFGEYAKAGQSAYMYSFLYNGSYLGVDAIICLVIISLIPMKQLYTIAKQTNY